MENLGKRERLRKEDNHSIKLEENTMVKCTKKIGIAQRRCRNVKGKAKKKKCLKRVMCGSKRKKRRKKR